MGKSHALNSAVRLALAVSAATAMVPAAFAQTAPATAGQVSIDEVVVTGSRIVVPNLTSISPVTSVTAEDVKVSGLTRVEDLLNNLPQVFASQGAAVSNGSNGTAEVNLRGLGSQRTVVLVNGRRLMPGDPGGSNAADLNQIPSALVQRIDVLTGGASSVYGADAVAGVVNFVMDTHFEGVRLEANYAFNDHHNGNDVAAVVAERGFALPDSNVHTGYTKDATFVLGLATPDKNGNAVFYATYRNVAAVLEGSYDFSSCTFSGGAKFKCGGSGTSFPATFITPNDTTNGSNGYIVGPGNVLQPYSAAANAYNFGPLNYFQRPDERYTAGAFLHYEFNPHADVYSELMFMKDSSIAQIAPSGSFFLPVNINCSDPRLSPSEKAYICNSAGTVLNADGTAQAYVARRNVEGGGRQADFEHESYRVVVGVRGELSDAWKYDVYGQYGSVSLSSVQNNYFSNTRIANALNSADGVTCVSGPPCVPWNIFQLGQVSPASLAYLQVPALAAGSLSERIADASVTGDLGKYGVKLPSAKDGLFVNIGAEYRQEKMSYEPDAASQSGDLAGFGGAVPPVANQFHVSEVFVEAKMPLAQEQAWAKALALEAGYRFSDYTTGSTTNTWKLGLEWQIVSDFQVRGSYQRAVRAPNIFELYNPQSVNLDGANDVCAGPNPAAANPLATAANCAKMGVTAAQYGVISPNGANQYNGLLGGNPELKPETSDTVSVGLVFTPTFVHGLNVSLDYFEIKIKDVISTVGADLAQNECLQTGAPIFCNLVHRDASGSLWRSNQGYVIDTNLNTGSLFTSGIDLAASYQFGMGRGGRMTLNLVGTYLEKLETEPLPGLGSYNCAGYFGTVCGSSNGAYVNPKWRHQFRATWATPVNGLDVSLAWRYIDSVDNEGYSSNDKLSATVAATDAYMSSRSYLDLSGSYAFLEKYMFRLGINNLLDKDPPIVSNSYPAGQWNGNTWPQTYDTLGRYVYMNFTAHF